MPPILSFTDQMQRQIQLRFPPKRIISLVPSQTELLHTLGLDQEVVGITKFCEHPEAWFRQKPRIGGTKQVHMERIAALEPDLIIGNKEENDQEQIEVLAQQYPVWMSDIEDLDGALEMIQLVGQLVGRATQAEQLSQQIDQTFVHLNQQIASFPPAQVAYLIWRKPYMAAASNTFIDALLQKAGFQNAFAQQKRYPVIEAQTLANIAQQYIFLSSDPYPFGEKHLAELQILCPTSVIKLVDGELFSWYGSRLLLAAPYFLNLQQELNT